MSEIKLIEIEIGFENADIFDTYAKFKMTDGCVEVFKPNKKEVRKLVEKFACDFLCLCNGKDIENKAKESEDD